MCRKKYTRDFNLISAVSQPAFCHPTIVYVNCAPPTAADDATPEIAVAAVAVSNTGRMRHLSWRSSGVLLCITLCVHKVAQCSSARSTNICCENLVDGMGAQIRSTLVCVWRRINSPVVSLTALHINTLFICECVRVCVRRVWARARWNAAAANTNTRPTPPATSLSRMYTTTAHTIRALNANYSFRSWWWWWWP